MNAIGVQLFKNRIGIWLLLVDNYPIKAFCHCDRFFIQQLVGNFNFNFWVFLFPFLNERFFIFTNTIS